MFGFKPEVKPRKVALFILLKLGEIKISSASIQLNQHMKILFFVFHFLK